MRKISQKPLTKNFELKKELRKQLLTNKEVINDGVLIKIITEELKCSLY